MISAILLAAGESKRMGQPKQLLPLGGKTIVEHSLDNLLASRVDEVILVIGKEAETVAGKVGKRQVKVVVNPDFRLGMSTSLKTGLKSISKKSAAVMVVLADQPFLEAALINRLIDEFKNRKKGIVVPVFQSRRGHPIIFDIKYREELLQLQGDAGAKAVLERHTDDILEVKASEHIHIDIDDMASYEAAATASIGHFIDRPADIKKAEKRIKAAGTAGIGLALLTVVQFFFPFAAGLSPAAVAAGVLHAIVETTGRAELSVLGMPPYFVFSLLFFAFTAAMTFGVFKKNKICSVALFAYAIICFVFSLSITTILFVISTIVLAAISLLLFYGIMGTFDYQQLKKATHNPGQDAGK